MFVCGPSGAGKDSVIEIARQGLAQHSGIVFARRIITRAAHPESDHDPVTVKEFGALRRAGGLAWHWEAHGFRYGVPTRYARQVAWGRVVVVNGSREHAQGFPDDPLLHRVLVTALPEQLATRLQRRGREDAAHVSARLARNERLGAIEADVVIHNVGTPDDAGSAFRRHREVLAGPMQTLP
ncbi:MAG: phosphonate metabolism protein/1,5-bisphosphokinase (PRPP-forming) PhnN [Ramlibacter sp.]